MNKNINNKLNNKKLYWIMKFCISIVRLVGLVYNKSNSFLKRQEIQSGRFGLIQNSSAGFSLIETLVAITILLVAIGGPLTIANRALLDARVVKNQTIAIFLAQDAMEHIRNIRDNNDLSGLPWLTNIDVCSPKCTVNTLETAPASIHNICNTACPSLRFDPTSGLYGYDSNWQETIFTRTVNLTSISDDEAVVTVDISWGDGVFARTISLKENLLNWRE